MKKFLVFLCAVTLVFGVVGSAGAVPWTWTDNYDPDDIFFSGGHHGGIQNHTFVHSIIDEGFDPFEDLVITYDLTMNFYDDSYGRNEPGDRPFEWVSIDLPGFIADQVVEIDFSDVDLGMSLFGWAQLNLTGELTVNIERVKGDFYFGQSQLAAHGNETAPVPEPSTILLLGVGLLGLAGFSRKRLGKKN